MSKTTNEHCFEALQLLCDVIDKSKSQLPGRYNNVCTYEFASFFLFSHPCYIPFLSGYARSGESKVPRLLISNFGRDIDASVANYIAVTESPNSSIKH